MRPLVLGIALIGLTVGVFAAPPPKHRPTRLLVALSNKSGNWEIYLVRPDTREVTNLTRHEAKDTDPAWSPDGRQIAFVSDRDGVAQLWLMGADGKNPRAVSRDAANCSWLRWSPDGKRMAFVKVNDPNAATPEKRVCTVELATGKVSPLTDRGAGQPAWSPDGKQLAYVVYGEGNWALSMMDADGERKRDVGGVGGGTEPAWSPGGKRIAFTSIRSNQGYKLYVCDADGDNVRDLGSAVATTLPASPQWSPDGKTIVFREWDAANDTCQIAVVGEDGRGYRVLTAKAPHAHPRWSPDGKSLSYGRFEDKYGYFRERESATLVVSDADGKNARELLRGYGGAEWCPR